MHNRIPILILAVLLASCDSSPAPTIDDEFVTLTSPLGGGTGPSPTDLSPAGTAARTQVFTWTKVADATVTSYRLWLEGVAFYSYSADELGCGSGGGTTCTTPAITFVNGTRRWSVQGNASGGWTTWAPEVTITVGGTPPPTAPTDLAPSGAATISQVFTWTRGDATATSYRLWIGGHAFLTFTASELGCASATTCTTSPVSLPAGRSTQWSVQGIGAEGSGPFAEPVALIVSGTAPPTAPTNLTPDGQASASQAFSWNRSTSSTSYRLAIFGIGFFTYTPAELGCDGAEVCTTPPLALPPGYSTTWSVQASNAGGSSAFSTSASLVVSGNVLPGKPTPIGPSGSVTSSQVFSWTRADSNATSYRIWLEGVAFYTYTAAELGCDGAISTCTTPAPVTLPMGTRQWAVQGENASGYGNLSSTLSISVSDLLACTPSVVVISQVYGGGGNPGAPWKNDFVELHNRSATATVNLSGWSIQYASATGSSWSTAKLNLTGSIAPGGYYLIQLFGAAAGNGSSLPTPNQTATTDISGTNGKVALVSSTTALSGTCPTGGTIVDFVGYGTANCSETTAAPAASTTTAVTRGAAGCTDTGSNSADFTAATPTPRNNATTTAHCSCE